MPKIKRRKSQQSSSAENAREAKAKKAKEEKRRKSEGQAEVAVQADTGELSKLREDNEKLKRRAKILFRKVIFALQGFTANLLYRMSL